MTIHSTDTPPSEMKTLCALLRQPGPLQTIRLVAAQRIEELETAHASPAPQESGTMERDSLVGQLRSFAVHVRNGGSFDWERASELFDQAAAALSSLALGGVAEGQAETIAELEATIYRYRAYVSQARDLLVRAEVSETIVHPRAPHVAEKGT